MKEIKLSKQGKHQGRYVAIVDDEDFERLNEYNWFYTKGRACRVENRKHIAMHNEIMNTPIGKEIDHINRNALDNRKVNLRICTRQQNICNEVRKNKSGLRGVHFRDRKKPWVAYITVKRKQINLGSFNTEKEAAIVYDKKAKELFGEFATLNFPNEAA